MGKESQLLEAAQQGHLAKVEKLLGIKKKKLSLPSQSAQESSEIERLSLGVSCPGSFLSSSPAIADKFNTVSVDVNCVDVNGSTPLILSAFHGHKDVVCTLLLYSADVNAQDYQGNTAVHMAAWQSRNEVVEILVENGADVNKRNMKGSTALHYASQYCTPSKLSTVSRILHGGANIMIEDKDGDTAFDLAARYDKREVVSMFVDTCPQVLLTIHPLVVAAQSGRLEVVDLLLNSGMDPNAMDERTQSFPLHEAVRYFRWKIAKLLLEFGASLGVINSKEETPESIVESMPHLKQGEYSQLFGDSSNLERKTPKTPLERSSSCEHLDSSGETSPTTAAIVYPLLRNKKIWINNTREHCSVVSNRNPCTNLVDGNLTTYWSIRSAGGDWLVFDFGSEYALNGVRIYGWAGKQMLNQFTMERGDSNSGPWIAVGKYSCDLLGSESIDNPPVSQDIRGFYGSARFWKLTICSNYGDPVTCFHGIQFFGIETGVLQWFMNLDCMKYCKSFVEQGCNQLSDLALFTEEKMREVVNLPGHRKKLLISLRKLRNEVLPITRLEWCCVPANRAEVGFCLPAFSVFGDPYSAKSVKLIAHGDPTISGETEVQLVPFNNGSPSKAVFNNIFLSPAGKYCLEVQSVEDPSVYVRTSEPIIVVPAPKRGDELDKAFDDIQCLLSF